MFKGGSRRPTVNRKEACDLVPNPDETMENFITEIRKALWHAYDMLDIHKNEQVHISQLKVITSSIGLKLGFEKSEKILDKEGLKAMDYNTYFEAIQSDLLEKADNASEITAKPLGERLNDVIKICWTFCSFKRAINTGASALTSEHCLKLWRLFNFLAETDEDVNPLFPIQLNREEASILFTDFIDTTGQRNKQNFIKEFIANDECDQTSNLSFSQFQVTFEKNFVEGLTENDITLAINSIYEKYVLDLLLKGSMLKRGYSVKSWKERWLALTSTRLNYYSASNEKSLKGCIEFDKDCSIEMTPDRHGQKPNRFVLQTAKKPYEMSASDLRTKNEWISAIQSAIDHVGMETSMQQEAAQIRCRERMEKQRLLDEDGRKRQEDLELLQKRQNELDGQTKKCAEAEAKLEEEQILREAEQERLRELEEIKRELERLLAEEQQAKRDEEIVRTLQARLLEDEFQKREELETLKTLQEEMLLAERHERADLESERQEQERALREAQQKLEQLEKDKAVTAERMQEAVLKLQKAEKDRHIMEEKVKLWKTPVGLARPIQPHVPEVLSHRGLGAFPKEEFQRKMKDRFDKSESPEMSRKSISDDYQNEMLKENLTESKDLPEIGIKYYETKVGETECSLEINNTATEMSSVTGGTEDLSQNKSFSAEDNESEKQCLQETDSNTENEEETLVDYCETNEEFESIYQIPNPSATAINIIEDIDHENQDAFELYSTVEKSNKVNDIAREMLTVTVDNQETGAAVNLHEADSTEYQAMGDRNGNQSDDSETEIVGEKADEDKIIVSRDEVTSDDIYENVSFP